MKIQDGDAYNNGIDRANSTTSIAIQNLVFYHGRSSTYGGGLSVDGNVDIYISDCVVLWCVGAYGAGGIYTLHGVSFTMERSKILRNVARSFGGGVYLLRKSCNRLRTLLWKGTY